MHTHLHKKLKEICIFLSHFIDVQFCCFLICSLAWGNNCLYVFKFALAHILSDTLFINMISIQTYSDIRPPTHMQFISLCVNLHNVSDISPMHAVYV